jgi:hypothetical protein
MKNSVLMRSINTLYFRQNNSLILKLTSGQRKKCLMFTSSEYFDMLVLYGQCDESATVAAQEYAVRFPNREHPSRNTITRKIL